MIKNKDPQFIASEFTLDRLDTKDEESTKVRNLKNNIAKVTPYSFPSDTENEIYRKISSKY